MTKNWKKNRRKAKVESLQARVKKIKDSNMVVNLSQCTIPDLAYIYLANGLKLVESETVDKEDLRFDLNEFIRKVSWKAYFHRDGGGSTDDDEMHKALRVKSNKYPDFSTPLLEEVKTKIQSWLLNFTPTLPEPNISPQALQGRKWVVDNVKSHNIFVTRADKGGAIIILLYWITRL